MKALLYFQRDFPEILKSVLRIFARLSLSLGFVKCQKSKVRFRFQRILREAILGANLDYQLRTQPASDHLADARLVHLREDVYQLLYREGCLGQAAQAAVLALGHLLHTLVAAGQLLLHLAAEQIVLRIERVVGSIDGQVGRGLVLGEAARLAPTSWLATPVATTMPYGTSSCCSEP